MAVFERKYVIAIRDVGVSNSLTNKAFLKLFEDIASNHSEIAGYGINQMGQTHLSWVLLQWKVRVFKRAIYNETVTIKTWARNTTKCLTYRDFEMYDEKGNLLCIASSKWALVSTDDGKILKIASEIIEHYNPENDKSVFGELDIPRLAEPEVLTQSENSIKSNYTFTVLRRDIDINHHMHNLYYIDYALEALPQEVYDNLNCNEFEIMYKSGAKVGDTINCFYVKQSDAHFVVMKNAKDNRLHAIIKLYI